MNLMDRNEEETNPLDMKVGTRLEADCESNMEGTNLESDMTSMTGFMKEGRVNETRSWQDLWNELRRHKLEVGNSPWLILGDFNVTLHLSESMTGTNYVTAEMKEFRDCVSDIEFEDLSQARILYTGMESRMERMET
ncbi:hypothetical protein Pint_24953 [Pistacia integerrima]|uniref:Uncharacterized protein n=1 Tax=Pistacia integerrima TaxID=434235 RepID=A0ACC0YHE8_9ROSI|nr:hypothetical protein Pint_24953 [Pistacia integerrima]